MNQVRSQIKKDFTIIPNALINDRALTPEARFLFVYLCSKPDDWDFTRLDIMSALSVSKNTYLKLCRELEDAGWMQREQKIENGEFSGNDFILFSEPQTADRGSNFDQYRGSKIDPPTVAQNLSGAKIDPLTNNKTQYKKEKETKNSAPRAKSDFSEVEETGKNDFFNSVENEAINSREKLLKKISAGDFFPDTPAARLAVLELYKEYAESQEFKDQWAAMADTFPKADAGEVIKAWCMNADWWLVKSVQTNRLSNWIRISHKENSKNAEKSTNTGNRNGHQISPDRRAEVQRILGWTTGTGEG